MERTTQAELHLSPQHSLSNLGLPIPGALKAVRIRLVIQHGLVDLFFRGDYKGTVLDYLVVVGLAGDDDWNKR